MKRLIAGALLAAAAFVAQAQTLSTAWVLYEVGSSAALGRDTTQALCDARAKALSKTSVYRCDRETSVTVAQPPTLPTLTLSGLPDASTQEVAASVGYSVSPDAVVWCRLDNYAPIVCPKPLVLSALKAGQHKIDFYVGTAAPDAAKPFKTHSWTVTPPVVVEPPVVTPPPSGAAALSSAFQSGPNYALEAPDASNGDGYGAKPYSNGLAMPPLLNGLATIARGGVVRLGPTTLDGQVVIRHEVRSGDPVRNSGNRAELSYDSMQLQHGVDYWMAFAIKLDADWTAANSGGSGDQQSLMQVHQQNSETTLTAGGPFGVKWRGNAGSEIEIFSLGAGNSLYTRFVTNSIPNVWMKFIVHYRSGVTTAQAPVLEVWKAVGGGAFTKLVDRAPGVLFGDPAQKVTRDWAKIGIYKWTTGTYGSATKRGMYSSGLFFGKGVDLYAPAASAVAAFQ